MLLKAKPLHGAVERRHTRIRLLLALAGLLPPLLCSSRALAYRTAAELPEIDSSDPVVWVSPTVNIVVKQGAPQGIPASQAYSAILRGLELWSEPACTDFATRLLGVTDGPAQPGDGMNTIEWVETNWQDFGAEDEPAVTDVQFAEQPNGSWAIVEADIYLNAMLQSWTLGVDANGERLDIATVVAHEAGHLLGLLHPCELDAERDVPDCDREPSARASILFPLYGSTRKLAADDVAGVCALYPSEEAACEDGCETDSEDTSTECSGGSCIESSCESDRDCATPETCVDGQCVRTEGVAGDPCASSRECASGVCDKGGYCALLCTDAEPCPGVAECSVQSTPPVCIGPLQGLGQPCADASECMGGACVGGVSDVARCTRECGMTFAPCPAGWTCGLVDGRNVCLPLQVAGGGGCRLAAMGAVRRGFPSRSAVLLLAMTWLVRRRSRGALCNERWL